MALTILQLLIAYGLGSVSGTLLLGRWKGVDVRASGSGNAGAANAMRVLGWRFALGAVLIDVAKGVLAAWLAPQVGATIAPSWPHASLGCGLAAVVGHIWPLWHGFRGGKGVAVSFGVLLVVLPLAALIALAVWLLALLVTGYSSLGSLLAAAVIPAAVLFAPDNQMTIYLAFAVSLNALVCFAHRDNFRRLMQSRENRFEAARLIGRRKKR